MSAISILLLIATLASKLSLAGGVPPRSVLNSVGMRLSLIPAGKYLMGSPPAERGRLVNEGPLHQVHISKPFYLGTYEVSVGEFKRFVESTGYLTEAERDAAGGFGIDFQTGAVQQKSKINWRNPGFPNFHQTDRHPVILISWKDAEAFCRWLSMKEHRIYRLPTEAEWEYAARAGSRTAYWTGESPETLRGAANIGDAALKRAMPAVKWTADWDDGQPFTAPAGTYRPNAFGLYDMIGNAWEWCSDWHDSAYYRHSPSLDPRGPKAGAFHVIRGGGWFNGATQGRSAQRIYFDPTFRYCLLSGFRVVMQVE